MTQNVYQSGTHGQTVSKIVQTEPVPPRRPEINELTGVTSVYNHPDISNVTEYIKDKFYLATLREGHPEARTTENIHFLNIDNELIYNNFYNDFGPLNIACLYRYCCKVNKKLKNPLNKHKILVHCTSRNERKRANSAYLIASYAILYLNKNPKEAYKPLVIGHELPLKLFQDASMGPSIYNIHLLDCLNAVHKAASLGFFDFNDFDVAEYEKYGQIQNGDLNWMVPQKFLAFVSPSTELGTIYHPPECYIDYFVKTGVVAVVRLNKKTYDASRFTKAGIPHYDMFMPDGTVPPKRILSQFLQLAENTQGPIAVHCKAGLGRTGSLIAAYLMKHYEMMAREAIAWIRICRPGSVIGHQQAWLENMECNLWNAGQQYRLKNFGDSEAILHHRYGIYSITEKLQRERRNTPDNGSVNRNFQNKASGSKGHASLSTSSPDKPKLNRILGKLRYISGTNSTSSNVKTGKTQGDRLNEIKVNRSKLYARSVTDRKSTTSSSSNTKDSRKK